MRATDQAAATRRVRNDLRVGDDALKERRSMPLLSATGPVQERNRDVNDPAAGALGPLSAAAPGSFTSRLPRVRCGPAAACRSRARTRQDLPAEPWPLLPGRRRSDRGLFGSEGARQGCPPFRRRCAALTRAMRSRCSGQLSERRPRCSVAAESGLVLGPDAIQEFGHLDDLDAFVLSQAEEVRVSGNDQLRLG